ncbi:MAG: hypothetical protein NT075_27135 [Chloroflexi bacterium]|nr:hypothetical protein [Chloroflexota bacterium]
MKAFLIMGRTFKAAYDDLFLCVFLSIAWWVGTLILPIAFGSLASRLGLAPTIIIPIAALLMLPAAPIMMGIHRVANRIANYQRVDNSFFWEGTRYQIWRGLLLFALIIFVPLAIAFNIWFYFNSQGWLQIVGVAWAWLLLLCLMMGQYLFPLFWQQDNPDIKLAIRNAALLTLRHPLYSFLMLLFQLVLFAICAALTLPLILLAPALLALAANFGMTGMLQEMGLAPLPPEAPVKGT